MSAGNASNGSSAWDQRRVLTSLRIERAGLTLMSRRGVDVVTADQIARAADISVRTFFRYFRNPREILTAVPVRESRRMCAALLERPAGESLLDGLHAWFSQMDDRPDSPTATLEAECVALWSVIVGQAPDLIQSETRATTVLGGELEEVVRVRLGFGVHEQEEVGVLATALAAVIWYVYTRSLVDGHNIDLMARLDRAVDLLGHLQATTTA